MEMVQLLPIINRTCSWWVFDVENKLQTVCSLVVQLLLLKSIQIHISKKNYLKIICQIYHQIQSHETEFSS